MNIRQIYKIQILALGMFMACAPMVFAAESGAFGASSPPNGDPASEMQAAEKDFDKAAGEFANGAQRTTRRSFSETAGAQGAAMPNQATGQRDPRQEALQGSPATGYSGTWTDPATGDIITSVIAPTPPQNQSQNYPMIIEPQVAPDWNGNGWGNNGYNPGWGGGWQGNGQGPQWPSPGDPGYLPPPPPPHGGWHQGSWHNPSYHPGYYPSPKPPANFNPNYRPLRPNRPPQAAQPGQGNWLPGMGGQPSRPPANGSIWNPGNNMWGGQPPMAPPPGMNPGMHPGMNPGHWGGGRPPMGPPPGGWGGGRPQPRAFGGMGTGMGGF